MKTMRIYFSMIAFVIAIGGVYASKMVTDVVAYYYIGTGSTTVTPKQCFAIGLCSEIGPEICTTTTTITVNVNGTSVIVPPGYPATKLNTNGTNCAVSALRVFH